MNDLGVHDRKTKGRTCADAVYVGDVASQLEVERIVWLIQNQEDEFETRNKGGWNIDGFRRRSATAVAPIRRI